MNAILIQDAAYIAEASAIAHANHCRLRERYPFLPDKSLESFIPRIEWMTREGRVYGLEDEGTLCAFIGWFRIDDFRNLGPGALTPDWCSGVAGNARAPMSRGASRLMSPLVRRMMSDLSGEGIPIHAIGIPSTDAEFLDEFSNLSYGRIVLDAAKGAGDLLAALDGEAGADISPVDCRVRPARVGDALALSELDASLARHIGSPPVLMPNAHGSTADEWKEWLESADAVTFIAEIAGEPIGFIKADPPHFDVSWFVHGEGTLAVCGLYVDPSARGAGVGAKLLRSLAREGVERGYSLVSVDCETHNPEARAFWLSRFEPVTWSFERRL